MSGPGNSGLPGVKANDPENGANPNPFNPATVPNSVAAPTTNYQPYSPYSTPNFSLTPYSQYSGLAQQIAASMNPKIQPYAAPRTSLTDIPYAPWQQVYGGPQGGPFPGSLPTSTPPPGNTVPPVNIPPPNQPPSTRPPVTTPPPPPGSSAGEYGGDGTKDGRAPYSPTPASVGYGGQYAGLPPYPTPDQIQAAGGGRMAMRNWLNSVDPNRLAQQFGYVKGAHGVTPDSFFGTNAYKGPLLGDPAAMASLRKGGGGANAYKGK